MIKQGKNETTKKAIPPYLPYKTLFNFLDRIKVALPNRIDRSLMASYSGAVQSQLIGTLEYLNLIRSDDGVPTEKLEKFLHSEGVEQQHLLKEILTSSYSFLFKEELDLRRATSESLYEKFRQVGATGDTTRKCVAFFLKAAKDAGIELSPHIKKTRGRRPGMTKIKHRIDQSSTKQALPSGFDDTGFSGGEISLEKLLLSKFPSFDPAWPPEVQAKWFEGFKELMTQFKKKNE
jgi:hypothetical protein